MNNRNDYIFILLVILCAYLVFSSFKYLVFYAQADEGHYFKYASIVKNGGLSAFHKIFQDHIDGKENWLCANPLRVAYIFMSAGWMRLFGETYLALSSLSLFCYLLTLGISYYFSKKYFGNMTALLFSTLLAFSPLNMAMARRALVDVPANLFAVLSVWLFFNFLHNRDKIKYICVIVSYAIAILMREVLIFLAPVFIVYLCVRKYSFKKEAYLNDFLSISIYPYLIVLATYLIAAGGPLRLLDAIAIKINATSPAINKYALLYCAGPWFRYIVDFILLSPWTTLLTIGFFFKYFTSKERDERILYFVVILIFYLMLLNLFIKNVRYAMLLDTPVRLFAVLMISEIANNTCGKRARMATYLAVLAVAAYDYASFYKFFIINGIYDPINMLMLVGRGIMPLR